MTSSDYLKRAGILFRSIINDLKRDSGSAARDLGVSADLVEDLVAGRRIIPPDVLERAVRCWPVNERDFFPIHDDAPDGVLLMRAAESAVTSRILERGGRAYYEYRDTVMSRLAMFRPEWIRMLVPVQDDDPENPAVEWNNGHLLNQFTYFVGSVNYYYEWDGVRHCVPMRTGDSVSGLPYAPHSFTSRRGEPAHILALTYGGRLLGDAQHELSALGPDLAGQYAVRGDGGTDVGALLRAQLENVTCPPAELARRTGIAEPDLDRLLSGDREAGADELAVVAAALRVNVRDLLPTGSDEVDGVTIVAGRNAPAWGHPDDDRPDYLIAELAGTRVCPNSRGLEMEVVGGGGTPLRHGLHTYVYNLGPEPVRIGWRHGDTTHDETFEPDDSAYVKPFVPHWFVPAGSGSPARLLVLRIGGKVSGDAWLEASAIGGTSLRRMVTDSEQWYDPVGRNPARELTDRGHR